MNWSLAVFPSSYTPEGPRCSLPCHKSAMQQTHSFPQRDYIIIREGRAFKGRLLLDDVCVFWIDSELVDFVTYKPKHQNIWQPPCPFKGAVCRILTLLKHKNTIICLQTFRKHVKLTYLFIWKTMLQSVILLWKCAVRPGMSVFVMVCETRPLPVYPIVFRHPGLPVAGKHSVFNLIHCHVRSFLLVSLIWHPPHASNLRRRAIPSSPTYSTFK